MKLTALRANNPVAVMAAYGALRLLPGARLRWDGHSPELDWEGDAIDFIARLLPSRLTAREVTLIDDPRKIGGAEGYQQPGSRMPGEWLVAYAAETAEGLRPTGLLLLEGRHPFIANARETMTSLLKHDVRLKLQDGLIGPWRYEDKGLRPGAGTLTRGFRFWCREFPTGSGRKIWNLSSERSGYATILNSVDLATGRTKLRSRFLSTMP